MPVASAMTASAVPVLRRAAACKARHSVVARAQTGGNKPKPTTGTPKVDVDAQKIVKDVQEKWDKIEDKSSVAVYGVGAVTVLWLSSSLVSAINGLPVLPKLMELVGLAYSTWFVYRYLLFKAGGADRLAAAKILETIDAESREELISDVDELKKKISGDKTTV